MCLVSRESLLHVGSAARITGAAGVGMAGATLDVIVDERTGGAGADEALLCVIDDEEEESVEVNATALESTIGTYALFCFDPTTPPAMAATTATDNNGRPNFIHFDLGAVCFMLDVYLLCSDISDCG
jgi:hypothetical protein